MRHVTFLDERELHIVMSVVWADSGGHTSGFWKHRRSRRCHSKTSSGLLAAPMWFPLSLFPRSSADVLYDCVEGEEASDLLHWRREGEAWEPPVVDEAAEGGEAALLTLDQIVQQISAAER